MRFLIILILFTGSHSLSARDEQWLQGTLLLTTNKELRGELHIDLVHHVVLLRESNLITVYPAYRIHSVEFYDDVGKVNRVFISLRSLREKFVQYGLYEEVLSGSVAVLRLQKIIHKSLHIQIPTFEYFVRQEDELVSIHKFKSKIYPKLLREAGNELERFIHFNRLSPNNPGDAIKIIDFFNWQQAYRELVRQVRSAASAGV